MARFKSDARHFGIVICLVCVALLLCGLLIVMFTGPHISAPVDVVDLNIMDRFDEFILTELKQAEDAALGVRKKFWLQDDAEKGPVPNVENYGTSANPSSLQWLLDEAQEVLDGQNTLFSVNTILMPGTEVTYYLDETIFAITWKQIIDGTVYTISEIKISDATQFRRHLEDPVFDGPKLSTPTMMSQAVNAVVGSSADHYRGRKAGIIVYDGEVKRMDSAQSIDVCYVDKNGDLLFSYAGDFDTIESAQEFVDENNINFSMSFGPIIIDNGERREITHYVLGEVHDRYARSALCQMDTLHYLVITANHEGMYWNEVTMNQFAKHIETMGCIKAYALDGGNTGSIVMNGKLINRTTFGYERMQGDLIYFCTAIPEHSE